MWRTVDKDRPVMMVIGLNPSTADEKQLDPTLRRVLGFAQAWGYGTFVMTNLFAYRATNPIDMKASLEPIGPQNDDFLRELAFVSKLVLAAWGTHGNWLGRADEVTAMLTGAGVNLACLDTTKGGFPKHPLYVPKETKPQVFRRAVVQDSR